MNSYFFKDKNMPYVESRYDSFSSASCEKHTHDTVSIGANEDGPTELTCKNIVSIIEPGSLLLINPQEVHCCKPIDKTRTYHMIYLDKDWCKEIQDSIFEEKIDDYVEFRNVLLNDIDLYNEFIALNKLFFTKTFYMEKEVFLIEFLSKLFLKTYSNKKCEYTDTNDSKIVSDIKEIIDSNIDENITLNEISEKLEINQYKLIRIFKKYTFMTPHAYLINKKIIEAKKMIANKNSISDIIFSLGFVDQSHFIKNFKKIVGVTPNYYKNRFICI